MQFNPPAQRNAPPVAGNIMWARQLLRRIEGPMQKVEQNKSIMGTKESRRIVKQYNRVARALIEFEALWNQAWLKSVEGVRQGLTATLLVRHPETSQLIVNFDKDIAKLVREAKYMKRMGIAIPGAAQMVLLQDEKFNYYYQQLTHIVKEHSRIMHSIKTIVKPLLKPHIDDLDKKIAPGLSVLSWTSLNVDGFIHLLTQALNRFEELVGKVNDVLTNRVENNLDTISRMLLVSLPPHQSFSYEEFVSMQTKFIAKQGNNISVRNQEVRRTVQELIHLINTAPRENAGIHMDKEAAMNFNDHYYLAMYQAVAQASKNSFQVLQTRLNCGSKASEDLAEKPFFDVEINLKVPHVVVAPSLDEIQEAINTCAKKVLLVAKDLKPWAVDKCIGSFWDMLSHDMDIVKSVLLLKGAIDNTKRIMNTYIQTFNEFSFLWLESLNDQYERFVAKQPAMEDFEAKLKEYAAVESRLNAMNQTEHIGPLCISTAPIKTHLLGEAASWKQQFAQNLHKEGADKLHGFHLYVRETTRKLNGKIEDLEDVRTMMDILQEVSSKAPVLSYHVRLAYLTAYGQQSVLSCTQSCNMRQVSVCTVEYRCGKSQNRSVQ
jgi:dynein heavy chain